MMMRRSGTLSVIRSVYYDDEKKWDLVCDQVIVLYIDDEKKWDLVCDQVSVL